MLFYCLALVVLSGTGYSQTINCDQAVSPEMYRNVYVRREKDLEYNNVTISIPEGCHIIYEDSHYAYMTCPGSSVLGNRLNVSPPHNFSSELYFEHFVMFKRNSDLGTASSDQFVQFDLQSGSLLITAIQLSFLNSPANGISLPDITLCNDLSTNPWPNVINNDEEIVTKLLNNQDLSQTDHHIRTVAIQPNHPLDKWVKIRIKFTFNIAHDFDWLFLSEVRFCTDSQQNFANQREVEFQSPLVSPSIVHPGADDLSRRSVELVCSVSSEGRYHWSWERENHKIDKYNDGYQITFGDGSRTTKLTINNLSFNNTATYKCNATKSHSAAYTLTYPEIIITGSSSSGYILTGEVTLNCELHGYQSSLTPPVWLDMSGSEITSSPKYTISTFDGSHIIILENGTTVPSILLSTTIHNISHEDEGNYTCRGVRGAENVTQLTIMEGTKFTSSSDIPITTKGSQPFPESTSPVVMQIPNDGNNAVIIAVSIIMAVIVLTVSGILITILVLMIRLKSISSSSLLHENQYVEVGRKSQEEHNLSIRDSVVPPIPPQNFDEADFEELGFKSEEAELEETIFYQQSEDKCELPTKLVAVNFKGILEDNPIYNSQPTLEGCSEEDYSLCSYDVQSCNIHPDDAAILEPNPLYDSTPAAIGYMENNPLYDGIISSSAESLLSKQEPFYHELLLFESMEKLNKDVQEGKKYKFRPFEPIYANPSPLSLKKSFEIEPENVCEVSVLGIGQFGEVMLAKTVGLSEKDLKLGDSTNKNAQFLVAVKKLKDKADNAIKESFEKEISFMSGLSDENIVCMLAVCKKQPKFIVLEYMENGDLYQFLNRHELALSNSESQKNYLQVSTLLYMSVQIASGMKYLASLKYVHRDLASRNCLIGQNFIVKVSDFGMSRNLYESVYYRVRGRAMLPIRWIATESFYGIFCEKTDIWSFGVTMWEIFTLGRFLPYNDLDDQQVIDEAVRNNKRKLLLKPEACPEEVYSVMLQCWEHELNDRANFSEVHKCLNGIFQNSKS